MSGSRTKTGCYSCRIRKKKCDEQRPICGTCRSRDIHCYGYGAPPAFMEGKHSRDEILNTKEALEIRGRAEEVYKARRRSGLSRRKKKAPEATKVQDTMLPPLIDELEALLNEEPTWSEYLQPQSDEALFYPSPMSSEAYETSYSLITKPRGKRLATPPISPPPLESIWWDSTLCASFPSSKTSRNDMRLLMIFMDAIFPLQYGFYKLPTSADRSWALNNVLKSQPFYHATLGLSYCFESLQSQGVELSVTPQVVEQQTIALHGLQNDVDQLGTENLKPKELLNRGIQTLSAMNQLLSLELFSTVEGHWEIHLQAARTLLGMIQNKYYLENSTVDESRLGALVPPIEKALLDSSLTYDRKALELNIACFVWGDVLAAATHGPYPPALYYFNYLPLLRNGTLKTEKIMGCQSWVMLAIAEITELEDWRRTQLQNHSLSILEMATRASKISHQLTAGIEALEQTSTPDATSLEADSDSVTLIFAHAALVYLHVIISGAYPAVPDVANNVVECLEKLEALPSTLIVRVAWPYAIAGCMAREDQYERFREVVKRTVRHGQPLGTMQRAVMVMEECWRLREKGRYAGEVEFGACGWREAMGSLGVKVLFI